MRLNKFDSAVTCLCGALLGFFGWHALHGPRGFPYREELAVKTAALTKEWETLKASRESLEQRVASLRPESIDPDMLDEQVRDSLFLAKPNEILVGATPESSMK